MKIAVMQPYFFPYIGYWQLLHAVDRFIIFDDVNYITRGWINRNRILINGNPTYITLPLQKASQNRLICDMKLQSPSEWREKIMRTIENAYRRAPAFKEIYPVITEILHYPSLKLSEFLVHQLQVIANVLDIKTQFIHSSSIYSDVVLKGKERIMDICQKENAAIYINLPGGRSLYEAEEFAQKSINLCFIKTHFLPYPQRAPQFAPYLSILDMLMEEGVEKVKSHHLPAYDLERSGHA
ncbi:WbqC family protein [Oxalobacter sp. OttesenSCG-928-P03]|nr:WbqC family protein [Oxalobacter sp. OttesenSCG-928-P03]